MNSPAMTWRVRRIGRTLWSAILTNRTTWLSTVRTHRSAVAGQSAERLAPPVGRRVLIEPSVTSDAYQSLASLRLDRATSAVREFD